MTDAGVGPGNKGRRVTERTAAGSSPSSSTNLAPILDVGPFLAVNWDQKAEAELPFAALAVAEQWREVFGTGLGLCHIVGHGVADRVIEEVYAKSGAFFGLSAQAKQEGLSESSEGSGPQRWLP